MMITFLHDKLKGLLLLLLAVVGVSFIFFGNWTPKGGVDPASQSMGQINGRSLSLNEFVAAQRQSLLEITLETGRIPAAEQNELMNFQTWIRLLQIQAADSAQLEAQPAQLISAIKETPSSKKINSTTPNSFNVSPQTFSPRRVSVGNASTKPLPMKCALANSSPR